MILQANLAVYLSPKDDFSEIKGPIDVYLSY